VFLDIPAFRSLWFLYISVHTYVYIYMHACMDVSMFVYMFVCVYVCLNVCTYECLYACVFECKYVCMYVCMYMNACMHACTHPCQHRLVSDFSYPFFSPSQQVSQACTKNKRAVHGTHFGTTYTVVQNLPHIHHCDPIRFQKALNIVLGLFNVWKVKIFI